MHHAICLPRRPLPPSPLHTPPAIPIQHSTTHPLSLRYKISLTAIGTDVSCSLYAASDDDAESYGAALITASGTDDSDDFAASAGAPELFMSYTSKAAKFSFQCLDSHCDDASPTPSPTEPSIVHVDFCDSDEYDELEVIEGGFTYDNTYDDVTCVAETTEEDNWNIADYPEDFKVREIISSLLAEFVYMYQ